MESDIWIVREECAYRLLHGHLHLAIAVADSGEALVEVRNEGPVKVVRVCGGYLCGPQGARLPLRWNGTLDAIEGVERRKGIS